MSKKNRLVMPILKWVGGKRQLLPTILPLLPQNISSLQYVEPFLGGGALLFFLQPKTAIVADYNHELMNVYLQVKNNVDLLIENLKKHENTSEYFYNIRSLDRELLFNNLSDIEKASRIIYLNKTCFNGLYRVNSAGEFNAPFGSYTNPNIVNEIIIKAVSRYLNENNIIFNKGDYSQVLSKINNKSFVYLDPPYHPISTTSNFTGYIQGGWGLEHQIRLRDSCDSLTKNGIKFMLSNSSAKEIKSLYSKYNIIEVDANRRINSVGEKRGLVTELIIRNYE